MLRVIAYADPRHLQLGVLGFFLLYGVSFLDLSVALPHVIVALSSVIFFQWLGSRWAGLSRVEYRSALISGLSLCLLLRCSSLWIVLLAAAISIGSKFLIRIDGRHVFNPTNLGIAAVIVATGDAWICPGQWGSGPIFALAAVFLGLMVVNRACRSDVSLTFLGTYASMLLGRAFLLGDPMSIPLHQLSSGALIIFTFHMVSDPMTAPQHKGLRIVYGVLLAALAYWFRFTLFEPNALLYALVVLTPVVPILNRLARSDDYTWDMFAAKETEKS